MKEHLRHCKYLDINDIATVLFVCAQLKHCEALDHTLPLYGERWVSRWSMNVKEAAPQRERWRSAQSFSCQNRVVPRVRGD